MDFHWILKWFNWQYFHFNSRQARLLFDNICHNLMVQDNWLFSVLIWRQWSHANTSLLMPVLTRYQLMPGDFHVPSSVYLSLEWTLATHNWWGYWKLLLQSPTSPVLPHIYCCHYRPSNGRWRNLGLHRFAGVITVTCKCQSPSTPAYTHRC